MAFRGIDELHVPHASMQLPAVVRGQLNEGQGHGRLAGAAPDVLSMMRTQSSAQLQDNDRSALNILLSKLDCALQASGRNSLFGQKGRCANAVPQSHGEQLSLLREAFQIADRKERQMVSTCTQCLPAHQSPAGWVSDGAK